MHVRAWCWGWGTPAQRVTYESMKPSTNDASTRMMENTFDMRMNDWPDECSLNRKDVK